MAPSATTAARSSRSAATSMSTSAPVERPSAADPRRVDVGAPAEEGHRAGDVLRPAPAERVRAALALAAPTCVVDEDAVPVPGEQLGMADRTGAVAAAAVHDDHRGPVPRRDVPAREAKAVAGRELDRPLGAARRLADRLAVLVRLDDGNAAGTTKTMRATTPTTTAIARSAQRRRRDAAPSPRCTNGIATPGAAAPRRPRPRACRSRRSRRPRRRRRGRRAARRSRARGRRRRSRPRREARAGAAGRRAIAPTPAASEIAAARACWPSPTPGCRWRNASSSACSSAIAVATRKTPVSHGSAISPVSRPGAAPSRPAAARAASREP